MRRNCFSKDGFCKREKFLKVLDEITGIRVDGSFDGGSRGRVARKRGRNSEDVSSTLVFELRCVVDVVFFLEFRY